MLDKKNAIAIAGSFLADLKMLGYNPTQAWLFGSIITGNTHPYSDIDLAVWDNKFTGVLHLDGEKIKRLLLKYKLIEFHSFPASITENENPFIGEIKKTGGKDPLNMEPKLLSGNAYFTRIPMASIAFMLLILVIFSFVCDKRNSIHLISLFMFLPIACFQLWWTFWKADDVYFDQNFICWKQFDKQVKISYANVEKCVVSTKSTCTTVRLFYITGKKEYKAVRFFLNYSIDILPGVTVLREFRSDVCAVNPAFKIDVTDWYAWLWKD